MFRLNKSNSYSDEQCCKWHTESKYSSGGAGRLSDRWTVGKNVTESTTLAELGYTDGDGTINLTKGDGTTKSLTVSQGTTVQQFIASLKEAGVNASYDTTNRRFYISSKETGADNDFTITGGNTAGINALSKLGLSVDSDATLNTYKMYAKYADGTTSDSEITDKVKKQLKNTIRH